MCFTQFLEKLLTQCGKINVNPDKLFSSCFIFRKLENDVVLLSVITEKAR